MMAVATTNAATTPGSRSMIKGSYKHPLDPLTASEITQVSSLLKARCADQAGDEGLHFKFIAILEPPKRALRAFLRGERHGHPVVVTASGPDSASASVSVPSPARRATTLYYHRGTANLFTAVVNLDRNQVERIEKLPYDVHAQQDPDELVLLRNACLSHPKVLEAVRKYALPDGYKIVCDTWSYGRDSPGEQSRLVQCYLFAERVDHPGANHYDDPLPFSPIFDMTTHELVQIAHLPTGAGHGENEKRTFIPHAPREYHHDLQTQAARTDLKPLFISQPQGPSFNTDGHSISWQKWNFRLDYNWREGMVLHDVTYDGREIFHRLSLCEMFVPYGDPRYPYSRKSVFDIGDIGAGVTANDLSLGCDCLGVIKYFSFVISNSNGEPIEKPNAVCMHEIDDGIGWKHTNTRTGAVSIVRSRVLVLQSILTVGNYEYILAWHLDQAAGLHYKIQATGILSTALIDPGVTVPWGTNVNETVMAPFHQHVFCLRIDPSIDGDNNSFIEEDTVVMPINGTNPSGVGYVTEKRLLEKACYSDAAPNRVHKIINSSHINKVSGHPVAYSIHTPPRQMLLAHPDSWHGKRAKYAYHPFWVTPYRDSERYPAGDYTYQSLPNGKSDLGDWVAREESTEDKDIVVWHSISLTHNPRLEDYPVMPCETMMVSLKPSGFFEQNPALDVPQSTQAANQSTLVEDKALEKAIEGDHCKHGHHRRNSRL